MKKKCGLAITSNAVVIRQRKPKCKELWKTKTKGDSKGRAREVEDIQKNIEVKKLVSRRELLLVSNMSWVSYERNAKAGRYFCMPGKLELSCDNNVNLCMTYP